jgi:hypothetical protein
MEPQHITKDEAIAAATANAFTVDDPDLSNHGCTILHCRMSFTGTDWDLAEVVALIERADEVAWVDSFFRHDLAVLADGSVHYFDVARPDRVSA